MGEGSGARQSDTSANQSRIPRIRVAQFAAYVGAVSVSLYQIAEMVAWGGGDLLTAAPADILLGLMAVSAVGALLGIVATGLFFSVRWFFKLDREHGHRP